MRIVTSARTAVGLNAETDPASVRNAGEQRGRATLHLGFEPYMPLRLALSAAIVSVGMLLAARAAARGGSRCAAGSDRGKTCPAYRGAARSEQGGIRPQRSRAPDVGAGLCVASRVACGALAAWSACRLLQRGLRLAGFVLESAAGQRYEDFIASRLFRPLGMEQAGFVLNDAVRQALATGYDADARTPIRYWHMLYRPFGRMRATAEWESEDTNLLAFKSPS